MKIVINTCYGGFSLSSAAILELIRMGSPLIRRMPIAEWGRFEKQKAVGDGFFIDYLPCVLAKDDIVYTDNARAYENRTHPDLIAVVKKLGRKANGAFAELKVVKIPDGVEWEISDYDGLEEIHEAHRTWG